MNTGSAIAQFDTRDYAKKLEAAGVPISQAEAQAKALGEAIGTLVALNVGILIRACWRSIDDRRSTP